MEDQGKSSPEISWWHIILPTVLGISLVWIAHRNASAEVAAAFPDRSNAFKAGYVQGQLFLQLGIAVILALVFSLLSLIPRGRCIGRVVVAASIAVAIVLGVNIVVGS